MMMSKGKKIGLAVASVLLVLGIFLITQYNSFVKKEAEVKASWSEVENTYQRRLDLLPNLVSVVKGMAGFEQSTLENIATARSKAAQINSTGLDGSIDAQMEAQNGLAEATNKLIVSIEQYPALRGTEAYLALQAQLEGTERRIKYARNDFNAKVKDYNQSVRQFPSSLAASILGFKSLEGFIATAGSEKAVEIKFNK